jgi:hypothetical protein
MRLVRYNFRTHQIARRGIARVQRWRIVFDREETPEQHEDAKNRGNDQQGIVPSEPGEIKRQTFTVIISNRPSRLDAKYIPKFRPMIVQFLVEDNS